MSGKDLVTWVEFAGKRVDVEFRISDMVKYAEAFVERSGGKFKIGDLAMFFADGLVLGTIRERERVAHQQKGAN